MYRLDSRAIHANGDLSGEKTRALFTSGGGTGTDYCIGVFRGGSWVNYTRHYPAGTYNVVDVSPKVNPLRNLPCRW